MYKKIYSGQLYVDEYMCLQCGKDYLIEQMNDDFCKGDKVFVRYFLSDKLITEDEANLGLILKTIGGQVDDLDFILDAYSEYTILDYNETAVMGGHDLFRELRDAEGKYLLLIIEKVEE